MYRSRPGSETRKNERLARTRKPIKMSGANLFAAAHFYWLTCESNEHREEAERIRGGVRASGRRETKDRRKASRTACSQVAFFFCLHVSQTNTEKKQSGFEVAFV